MKIAFNVIERRGIVLLVEAVPGQRTIRQTKKKKELIEYMCI